jgi:hypothetical protein
MTTSATATTQQRRVAQGMIDLLAPRWSIDAGRWAKTQQASWRAAITLIGLIVLLISFVLLFGGGYTSIQGIRVPLALAGLPVATDDIPALPWWLIPAANTLIQIVSRRVPFLRWLWRPSIVYDGLTNAAFFVLWIGRMLVAIGAPIDVYVLGGVASALGLGLAIVAERAFLAALGLLRGVR